MNTESIGRALQFAADALRGEFDTAALGEYLRVLLFLKYVSDVNSPRFSVPPEARFGFLVRRCHDPGNAKRIDTALRMLEDDNQRTMAGLFTGFRSDSAEIKEDSARDHALGTAMEILTAVDLRAGQSPGGELAEAFRSLVSTYPPGFSSYAGELHTPVEVARLLAELAEPHSGEAVYDPACGTGGFLLHCAHYMRTQNATSPHSLWGQDSNPLLWRLSKMNSLLQGEDQHHLAADDLFTDPLRVNANDLRRFDVIVSNPPFSRPFTDVEWMAVKEDPYRRFESGLPPRSRADYGYIQHMIASMNPQTGRVATIVPRGVLFREGSEADIRQDLIERNLLDAVIGLPPKLFQNTEIPAVILFFRAQRDDDPILFIDASRDFDQGRKSNELRQQDIDRIVKTYRERSSQPGYSSLVPRPQIADNHYNLNITLYVSSAAPEAAQIDLRSLQQTQQELYAQLDTVRGKIDSLLQEFLVP